MRRANQETDTGDVITPGARGVMQLHRDRD
ncbi:MAG: hypothetical protein J07HQW2_00372, partial [Haloquadratum walsbyi J07HQW2]